MNIFIGNLSDKMEESNLLHIFSQFGLVKKAKVVKDSYTGKFRGFGFVEMSSEDEELAAIEALDGAEWMGRDLKVNKAKPREERPASGGWGDRGRNSRRY